MNGIEIFLGRIQQMHGKISNGLIFLLVLRGNLFIKGSVQNQKLEENDLIVINPEELYSLESRNTNVIVWIRMEESALEKLCPEVLHSRFSCVSTNENTATEPLYDSMRQRVVQTAMLHYRHEEGYELLVRSELLRLLHTLVLQFRATEYVKPLRTDNHHLRAILDKMEQNYKEPLSLEEMAEQFYLSPSYLARLFRKEMSMTYLNYLNSLRLESSRRDLLHTSHSVTRIALGNGFSGIDSLNRAFRKEFDCSPSEYRKKMGSGLKQQALPDQLDILKIDPIGSLDTLVRFVDAYEKREETEDNRICININASKSFLRLPARILCIGDFARLLRKEIQEQLKEAQKAAGFSYIHVENLFSSHYIGTLLGELEILELFNLLDSLHLKPLVRIESGDSTDKIKELLLTLRRRYGKSLEKHIAFEMMGDDIKRLFNITCTIREICVHASIGLRIDPRKIPEDFQSHCQPKHLAAMTDFLTTSSDPNETASPSDACSYERFHRHYHETTLLRLSAWMEEAGILAPIYLLEWNTLTGRSLIESGEFHRTALITDTLLALRSRIAAAGFRLNLRNASSSPRELLTYPLSLYLYHGIKRPLFFALKTLAMLGNEILWEENGVLVTRNEVGDYCIQLWAPYYIDPFLSLDNMRIERIRKNVLLSLRGLEPGNYRLKSLYLDKDNGSIYRSWVKSDMYAFPDDDTIDYLKNFSNPTITLEEQTIDDSLDFGQKLSLNAVALWQIQRIF